MTNVKPLSKRANRKYVSNKINAPLSLLDGPLTSYYRNALNCSNLMLQKDQRLITRYCNSRTCVLCNAIRTAKHINHYKDQLLELEDIQLVTLTAPTVKALEPKELRDEIDRREKVWRKMYVNANKQGIRLVGVKALECVPEDNNKYHPHFHLIIAGKHNAEWVVRQWLKHNPKATKKAQDIRPVLNEDVLLEVFKYSTKFITMQKVKDPSGVYKKQRMKVPPKRTDLIIQALYKKRVISAFGGIKIPVSDDITETAEAQRYEQLKPLVERILKWKGDDWYYQDNGEKLSDFKPTKELDELYS